MTQPLKTEEIDWIELTAGVRPGHDGLLTKIDAAEQDDAIKQRLLREAREALERDVGVIQVGEDFDVTTLSGFLKRSFTMASISDDPNEEFDTGHDSKKLKGALPPEQFRALMTAQAMIAKQSQILQTAFSAASKKKLFTDKEIANAIWEPLKRRKLIPENAIPDRYSEVVNTFSEASKSYETRLVAYTEALPKHQDLLDGLGVAKDLFTAGGAVTSAVIGDLKILDPGLVKNPSEVMAIITGVQMGTTSSISVAQTLIKAKDEKKLTDPDVLMAVCKDTVKGTQAIVTAGFSGQGDAGKALGKAITTGIGMATNVVAIGVKIKQKKYDEILDDIGEMVTSSFEIYSSNVEFHKTGDEEETVSKNPSMDELGKIIGESIKAAGKLLKFAKDPSPEEFLNALLGIVQAAANAGAKYLADHQGNPKVEEKAKERDMAKLKKDNPDASDDELDEKYEAYKKDPNSSTSFAKDVIEGEWLAGRGAVDDKFAGADKKITALMKKSPEEIKKAIEEDPQLKNLAERLLKQNKVVEEEGLAAFKEEVEQDNKDFRSLLNRAETGETEEDVQKVEALIMALKRDQMMLDLAFQLSGMTAQVVAAFLPQAGIAVSAIELVKNLTKAAQHFRAYGEWQDNVSDAKAMMSVQMEAMTNRMDLSRGQATEACVKALEAAAKLVCGAVACAGPFAPAGHAAGAAMGGVTAIRELVTKYYREHELSEAWKLFLKARANPDDRKNMRKALRTNPTLSKYAIAYGAEVEHNPVARNAMRKCGLSNDVLDSKDANVDKVVSFLEALYPEDPVLLRPLDKPHSWYPGVIEFSAISFSAFAGAAATKAKVKLAPACTKTLTLDFTRWERDSAAYKTAYDDWMKANAVLEADTPPKDPQKAQADVTAALHTMQNAGDAVLRSINMLVGGLKLPKAMVTADGKAHEGMQEYLGHLLPIASRLKQKYQRETAAMAQQEGAIVNEEAVKLAA